MNRSRALTILTAVMLIATTILGTVSAEQPARAAVETRTGKGLASVRANESQQSPWTLVGLGSARIGAVLADPRNSAHVYVSGGLLRKTGNDRENFFESNDGGLTWVSSYNHGVGDMEFDPYDPEVMYSINGGGVYKSTDGGVTWDERIAGMPMTKEYDPPFLIGSLRDIAIAPTNPPAIFVTNDQRGLFRSMDGAASWQQMDVGNDLYFATRVVISPSAPETVYLESGAGLFKSEDLGISWRKMDAPADTGGTIALNPNDVRDVYLQNPIKDQKGRPNSYKGLWHSTDGGETWYLVDGNFITDQIMFAPHDPGSLLAPVYFDGVNAQRRVFWSRDGGRTWIDLGRPSRDGDRLEDLGKPSLLGSDYDPSYPVDVAVVNGRLWVGTYNGVWQRPLPTVSSDPYDDRFFPQTGFRVDNDAIWDYFSRRGGVNTFGYPISRALTLQGFTTQIFQRRIIQLDGQGRARLLNLLDQDIMPYTSINGTTLPSIDAALVASAPDPANASATLAFVKAHAPDTFNGKPVNFYQTFINSVSLSTAFPNGNGNPALLPGLALELWGIPISEPFVDPNNHNFIYQRFQRGIMHYDATCNCTQGILLAHYFKGILIGENVPTDLDYAARDSIYRGQYDPKAPNSVRDPSRLPNTYLTNAFVR